VKKRIGDQISFSQCIRESLGRDNPAHYYVDMGYNGFSEGFDITNDDGYSLYNLELRFPERRSVAKMMWKSYCV
jgi:hypothetical protein